MYGGMTFDEVQAHLHDHIPPLLKGAQRVLLIVPDATRTAPVATVTPLLADLIRAVGAEPRVLVALGTHAPMSDTALLSHTGFADRTDRPRIENHRWDDPSALTDIGVLSADRIADLSDSLLREDVPLNVNRAVKECDHILILGPVFPHEVAGFSGGVKYLFPGIAGAEIIDFFHWLGALIGNLQLIGRMENPVRAVLRAAADAVPVPVSAVSMVMHNGEMKHCAAGPVETSWRAAAEVSNRWHVLEKPHRFKRVLSCAPAMYDDLWTGGKCMYKCEPVVEDGGELVIYAPHIHHFSVTHGALIERVGYHVRDYILGRLDDYTGLSRNVLAHSSFVKGAGTYENGVEKPRIQVTLATGISRERCERANLGYLDPASIRMDDWKDREQEGILYVERGGETLYRAVEQPPHSLKQREPDRSAQPRLFRF